MLRAEARRENELSRANNCASQDDAGPNLAKGFDPCRGRILYPSKGMA